MMLLDVIKNHVYSVIEESTFNWGKTEKYVKQFWDEVLEKGIKLEEIDSYLREFCESIKEPKDRDLSKRKPILTRINVKVGRYTVEDVSLYFNEHEKDLILQPHNHVGDHTRTFYIYRGSETLSWDQNDDY